ncbi:septum formation family protein [Streptomyces bambusae]|uniref:septum formation family protein n=1 Tax=Streptomyces bambusae TaxID=1550616 RepID=UPI001CFF5203|nr:septum formation family protein [Streptomyces bambusae]MCB5168824.1 septum formation family protein [Streptomyces bambusae]
MSRPFRTPRPRTAHGITLACALLFGAAGAGPAFGAAASEETLEVEVGDCFNSSLELKEYKTDESGRAPSSVDIVPCDQPHQSEAFVTFNMPDGPYPGEKKIIAVAGERCGPAAVSGYVGADAELPDTMSVYHHHPSADTWDLGARKVVCFLGDPTGPTTGSVRAGTP